MWLPFIVALVGLILVLTGAYLGSAQIAIVGVLVVVFAVYLLFRK